jgi:transcription elongation factor Elf1
MSVNRVVETSCPRCEKKLKVVIWDSINAQINPEAKQALLNGEINVAHCSLCGSEYLMKVDLLYHDMDKGFCVQYFNLENIDKDRFFNLFSPTGQLKLFNTNLESLPEYFQNAHFVFSMEELAQYIVFRDRLAECKNNV